MRWVIFYGIMSFLMVGRYSGLDLLRFSVGVLLPMTIFLSFVVIAHWFSNALMFAQQAFTAIIAFSLYPITLLDGTAKLVLLTVLPAALVGAIPAELILNFSWLRLSERLLASLGFSKPGNLRFL